MGSSIQHSSYGHLFLWCCLLLVTLAPLTYGQLVPVCKQSFYSLSILENSLTGTTVMDFGPECHDPEGDDLVFLIKAANYKKQFILGRHTGVLTVSYPPDAEVGTGRFTKHVYTMVFFVQDNEDPPLTYHISVNVEIISINDNVPEILNLPASISIPENTPIGTVLASCNIRDGDVNSHDHAIPNVVIQYGNEDKQFALDLISCTLMLIARLNYETADYFNLTNKVFDLDPINPLSATQDLLIHITDVNDVVPKCVSHNIHTSKSEETAVGSIIVTLNCSDPDSGLGGTLSYTISKGDTTHLEILDSTKGDISLKLTLDYEAGDRLFEVEVRIADSSEPYYSVTATVAMLVEDADDNPPQFTKSVYTADISENDPVGMVALVVSATDADAAHTDLSRVTYGLEGTCTPDLPWFVLGSVTGGLLIDQILDFEQSQTWTCQVHAFSSDRFADGELASVVVRLKDINDVPPNFTKYLFEGSVPENAGLGVSVLTVYAEDPDSAANGELNFTLFDPTTPFEIDTTSGILTTAANFDYEVQQQFLFSVLAADRGVPSLTSHSYISVRITPENEFLPIVSPLADVSVRELNRPGTLITTVVATDGDIGDDGKLTFTFGDPDVPFIMEAVTGRLLVGWGLDFEVQNNYTLTVWATDSSMTSRKSTSTTVSVTVLDEDDNSPTCDPYGIITITPNTDTTAPIGQLVCRDVDVSAPDVTFIKISGDHGGHFMVHSSTGEIGVSNQPMAQSYTLLINVLDGGRNPMLTTTMPVFIQVETALQFDHPSGTTLSVPENTAVGHLLHRFFATGAYGLISFKIFSGNSDTTFFLHPSSGQLRTLTLLDRETTAQYTLVIRAESQNGFIEDSTVSIIVLDVNDNYPIFQNSYHHVFVSESTSLPITMRSITANDADVGENGNVSYAILSGNEDGKFNYNFSGNLDLIAAIDFETTPTYSLVLTATDGGNPAISTSCLVYVEIQNSDEGPPTFISVGGLITHSIPENAAIGGALFTLVAKDLDNGDSPLAFTFAGGNTNDTFFLSALTGEVYLVMELDREEEPSFSLEVKVENKIGQEDVSTLQINITDINDNDPMFNRAIHYWNVRAGTGPGYVLGTLGVTDRDIGLNGDVSLTLSSESPVSGHFSLSGLELQTVVTMDKATHSFYVLEITAQDAGSPVRSSTTTVSITILTAYLTPVFIPTSDNITYQETLAPGTLVYDVDTASGPSVEGPSTFGIFKYDLISGNDAGKYHLDPHSGKIYLIQPLDFAVIDSYNLDIRAMNQHSKGLVDIFRLVINVEQVNRHSPQFTETLYTFTISNSTVHNTSVGMVVAEDLDPGPFGDVTYTLEVNSVYSITSGGEIFTNIDIDETVPPSLHLRVFASDNAGVTSGTSTSVVLILNADLVSVATIDVSIHFSSSNIQFYVLETTPILTPIYILQAHYSDPRLTAVFAYWITTGDDGDIFEIDPGSGVLSLKSGLDFENLTRHVIEVEAIQTTLPALTGTTTVTIRVQDGNDRPPVFPLARDDITVCINILPRTLIHTVTAVDPEPFGDGQVSYVIESGNDPEGLFSIDPVSGEIRTTTFVTSAVSGIYTLSILAVDHGTPYLTGTVTVGVFLRPVATPGTPDHAFSVRENQPAGTVVGRIPANPGLAILEYHINSGNFDFTLSVASQVDQSALISTARVLDAEQYQFYQLTIDVVHSAGTNQLLVEVAVEDENDNQPVFIPSTLVISFPENIPLGFTAGHVTARDRDVTMTNSELDFYLDRFPSEFFSVGQQGAITVVRSIDYEGGQGSFSFRVYASDRGIPQKTGYADVTVTVIDVDETLNFLPITTVVFIPTQVPYNYDWGEIALALTPELFKLSASSSDNVTYADSGMVNSVFQVHENGEMTVNRNTMRFIAGARYYHWATCMVTSEDTLTSRVGLVRFDTFNQDIHMVVVVLSVDLETLESLRSVLEDRLQTFFTSPKGVRIYSVQAISSTARRNLLAVESAAQVVVLDDESVDDVDHLQSNTSFLTQQEILQILQASPDGTPVFGLPSATLPVINVSPWVSGRSATEKLLNPAMIAFISVTALLALTLVICILAILVYCRLSKRRRKNTRKTSITSAPHTLRIRRSTAWGVGSRPNSAIMLRRPSGLTGKCEEFPDVRDDQSYTDFQDLPPLPGYSNA